MAISRRQFVKAGTMVGLSAALPLSAVGTAFGQQRKLEQPASDAPEKKDLDVTQTLTKALFAAHLNTKFQIRVGVLEPVEIELIKVSDVLPSSSTVSLETSRQDCFSVVFRGPRERSLSQNTYHVAHSEIGRFDLFIVPAGEDENGKRYEAIFNHLRPYNLRRLLDLRRFSR